MLTPLLFFLLFELGLRVAGFGYETSFFLPARIDGQDVLIQNDRFAWRFLGREAARKPYPMMLPKEKRPGTIRMISIDNIEVLNPRERNDLVFDEHGGFYDHQPPPATVPTGDDTEYANPNYSFQFDRLGVRVPANARIPLIEEGASVQPAGSGYSFYSKTFANVKKGASLSLPVSYAVPVAAAPAAAPSPNSGPIAAVVLVLVGVGGAVAVGLGLQRKLARKSGAPEAVAKTAARSSSRKPAPSGSVAAGKRATAAVADSAEVGAPAASGSSGATKRFVVTALIVAGLVTAGVVLGTRSTKPQVTGDTIKKTFSQAAPCASSTVALALPASADPASTAEKLFSAVEGLPGLISAEFDAKSSSIVVGYCESQSNEAAVREKLSPTGLIAQ